MGGGPKCDGWSAFGDPHGRSRYCRFGPLDSHANGHARGRCQTSANSYTGKSIDSDKISGGYNYGLSYAGGISGAGCLADDHNLPHTIRDTVADSHAYEHVVTTDGYADRHRHVDPDRYGYLHSHADSADRHHPDGHRHCHGNILAYNDLDSDRHIYRHGHADPDDHTYLDADTRQGARGFRGCTDSRPIRGGPDQCSRAY